MMAVVDHRLPGIGLIIALYGLRLFFLLLIISIAFAQPASPAKLFLERHGRSHRLSGGMHLAWLVTGAICLVHPTHYGEDTIAKNSWKLQCLAYDIILGILGTLATLTAAHDFPHRLVTNRPGESGTLSREAVVTQGEMIEHAFYQGLNLCQALYLHIISWVGVDTILTKNLAGRMFLLWIVTLPWAWRTLFPVNSFSANWRTNNERAGIANQKNTGRSTDYSVQVSTHGSEKNLSSINKMYQVKKWQYVFYKHVILHGLNISIAFPKEYQTNEPLPTTFEWRIFWLCLNTSYVMEFFLQSLVKRGILQQCFMMFLNSLLMVSSSLAAMGAILGRVRAEAAFISVIMNFINRRHDILNTIVTGCIVVFI